MSFLLKNNIHTNLAKAFYSDVLSQRNMYYYFLGRVNPWPSDAVPPSIPDTFTEESDIRKNIVYMNRIGINDICFVTRRIDWVVDTVYDRYDGDLSETNTAASGATNIRNANFYVLTNEMNVYKCIHNNDGLPSVVKPTGTDYGVISLSDGYIWKYMYSLPPNMQYKFLTDAHMPVTTALYTRYYDSQSIDSVTIKNGGSGYEGGPITTAEVIGNGTDAKIRLSINPDTGSIIKARITNPGYGYTTGSINVITTDSKGVGIYNNNPTAILTPKFVDGKLVDVVVEDPGKNYSTDMQTNIIVDGTGSGAKLHPIVDNGTIVDVIIESPGVGYTEVYISIESVTGSGAELVISTGIGDIDSIQSDVELLAVPGAVYVVDTIDRGINYTTATCVIDGDGSGLEITPIIYDGKIMHYQVDSPGSGYTWCNINIVGDGIGATAKAIIAPFKGHGHNAIDELFGDTISVYNTLKFKDTQPLLFSNDYRQFGIIKNPEKTSDTSLFRDLNGSTCYMFEMDTTQDIQIDDILSLSTDTNKKFTVVGIDQATSTLLVQNMGGAKPIAGNLLLPVVVGNTYRILNITKPTVNKKSGHMLFVDNRAAIFQTSNQFTSLRTTIKF